MNLRLPTAPAEPGALVPADRLAAIERSVRLSPRRRRRRPRWWAKTWRKYRAGELRQPLLLALPLCAIAFAICAFGGVYEWAYGSAYLAVFVGLAVWVWQWWRGRRTARWLAIYAAMLLFGGWVAVQYATGISVVPASTLTALFHLSAAGVLFFLVTQTYRGRRDAAVLSALFAVFAGALALLAIAQILTSANGIYWHFTYSFSSPAGTYVNRNNFAGCMEMLIPLACVAAYQRRSGAWLRFLPWALAPALAITAVVLAASRGGALAIAVEAVAALGIEFWLARRPQAPLPAHRLDLGASWLPLPAAAAPVAAAMAPTPRRAHRLSLAAAAGLTVLLMAAAGTQRLQLRFLHSSLQGPGGNERQFLNQSSWAMFRERPWGGWGLGTWADVYPVFARFTDPNVYEFAHNDYLQMLTETGVIGTFCVLGFWLAWTRAFRGQVRTWQRASDPGPEAALAVAAAVGCLGLLVHSWVDFNLHIPANLLLFFALVGFTLPPGADSRSQERVNLHLSQFSSEIF